MARSRNLKPDFFENEELVECEFWVRLLFAGLWTLSDREGRLEDRPKRIKMKIFPADNVDVEKGLSDLSAKGFVRRYEVENIKIIQVVNFLKHQKPHHQEKKSTLPPEPPSHQGASKDVRSRPDSLNTDSLNTDSLNKNICVESSTLDEPQNENFKLEPEEPPDKPDQPNEKKLIFAELQNHFERFWAAGMRKVGKKSAWAAFERVYKTLGREDWENFTEFLVLDVKKRLDLGQLGFDQMHPTTYLNGERWTDEVKNISPRPPNNPDTKKFSDVTQQNILAAQEFIRGRQ